MPWIADSAPPGLLGLAWAMRAAVNGFGGRPARDAAAWGLLDGGASGNEVSSTKNHTWEVPDLAAGETNGEPVRMPSQIAARPGCRPGCKAASPAMAAFNGGAAGAGTMHAAGTMRR